MIRLTLLWSYIAYFIVVSWKDWYKGICGLVLLMAFIERPDVPKQMLDIPGLNAWNILFVNVLIVTVLDLSGKTLRAHLPSHIKKFLVYYVLFIMIAFFRELGDRGGIIEFAHMMGWEPITTQGMFQEDILNTIKYMVPGILLFYGCNSKERFKWAVWTLVALNFILAIQIIKTMPIEALTGGHMLDKTGIRKIVRYTGYFRSDLGILLAGAAWAIFFAKDLIQSSLYRMGIYGASALTVLAVALTGSRIGMGACVAIGLAFSLFRYRKILLIIPLAVLLIISFVPSVSQRFTQGFFEEPISENGLGSETMDPDFNSITSGRTIVWPAVIDEIQKHPFFGYGRRAMQRTGLSLRLGKNFEEPFPHPHNAYLELFLDNGFVLGAPILIFFLLMFKYSFQAFRAKDNLIYQLAGSIAFSFILTFLIGAFAQQSFYPTKSDVSLWCSIGILLRVREEYLKGKSQKVSVEPEPDSWVNLENTVNTNQ